MVSQVLGPKLASQNIATKVQWMACRGYPEEGYGLWTAWEMLPSSMQSSPPRSSGTEPCRPFLNDPLYHLSIQQPDVSGTGLALPDVSSFPNTSGFPSGTL